MKPYKRYYPEKKVIKPNITEENIARHNKEAFRTFGTDRCSSCRNKIRNDRYATVMFQKLLCNSCFHKIKEGRYKNEK